MDHLQAVAPLQPLPLVITDLTFFSMPLVFEVLTSSTILNVVYNIVIDILYITALFQTLAFLKPKIVNVGR